jgi:hypothetical protein
VNDIIQPFIDNPLVTVLGLFCIVLLFAILSGRPDDWMRVGRRIIVVIAGFILLAIIFGIVLSRTITT